MQIDYEFMKSSYKCVKDGTCDKCDIHTGQLVIGKGRTVNNLFLFCPAPVHKEAQKKTGGVKSAKVRKR